MPLILLRLKRQQETGLASMGQHLHLPPSLPHDALLSWKVIPLLDLAMQEAAQGTLAFLSGNLFVSLGQNRQMQNLGAPGRSLGRWLAVGSSDLIAIGATR